MNIASNALLTAVLAITSVSASLSAQTLREVTDSTVASKCRAIATEFSRSISHSQAYMLSDCAVTGPVVLADAWRSLNAPDSSELQQLMKLSAEMPDIRLALVILERAENVKAPLLIRRAAVATLAAFLDPSFVPTVSANFTYPSVLEIGIRRRTHGKHKPVLQSMQDTFRGDIRTRLQTLAASDASYPLASLAKRASGATPI